LNDLKESNQAARIRSKSVRVHPRAATEIFPGGQRRNFASPFQVANDAMPVDVHKTLHPFCTISLYWLTSILNLLSVSVFYSSAIRIVFSFHKLPNIHFFQGLSAIKS